MRILVAVSLIVAACGSPKTKKETNEVSDVPANCCCKTIPATAEKEIVPVYATEGRMECSTKQGECVPDVQCNGATQQPSDSNGVPPPPPVSKDNGPAVP